MSDVNVECLTCKRQVNRAYVRPLYAGGSWSPGRGCVNCEGDRNRLIVDRMRELIVELRDTPDTAREHAILTDLKSYGHPDVEGLVKALAEKRTAPAQRKRYA